MWHITQYFLYNYLAQPMWGGTLNLLFEALGGAAQLHGGMTLLPLPEATSVVRLLVTPAKLCIEQQRRLCTTMQQIL